MEVSAALQRIIAQYQSLAEGAENKRRREKWGVNQHVSRDLWRGTAKTDRSCQAGQVPVLAGMSNLFWHKKLGFSMEEYLLNPAVFLEEYLKICVTRFETIHDDFVLDYQIPLRMTSVFEAGIFGMAGFYAHDTEPHLSTQQLLEQLEDYKNLPAFDFLHAGLMPKALALYDSLQSWCGDIFEVHFPEWIRAPFGVALYLRGFNDLLMDLCDDPDAVKKLLGYITETQLAYIKQQAAYTGKSVRKINLFNDDVSAPIVSPGLYRDMILPQEQVLSDFCGGIHYWHSCGNLTPIFPEIAKLKHLGMIHCSAWSDPKACVESFPNTPIEICTNTQKDVLEMSEQEMYRHWKKICTTLNEGNACGYHFHLEGMEWVNSEAHSFEKVNSFVYAVRKAAEDAALL